MNATGVIERQALATYLPRILGKAVEILALRPLKAVESDGDDPKGFGYGVPFEVECLVNGVPRAFVVSRTRPAQGFGHDYPADRAWQALYGHSAYNSFPRQVDVGFVRASGELVSASDATEFFQVVEKAAGALYWLDLDRLLEAPLRPLDTDRAVALACFLAEAHATKRNEPTLYHRRVREPDVAVLAPSERLADGQHRAAQIGDDDDALAAVGTSQRRLNRLLVGAEAAAGVAADGEDRNCVPGHLPGELGGSRCEFRAVRYDYDPDRHSSPPNDWLRVSREFTMLTTIRQCRIRLNR